MHIQAAINAARPGCCRRGHVAAGRRRVPNGAVVSPMVHALHIIDGERARLGGAPTQSAGLVLCAHGFALVADFQELTAHFPMTLTVEQQQSQHWKQQPNGIGSHMGPIAIGW